MTARRDFLAFTCGAIAARTVLPVAAQAAPKSDAELIRVCAAFDACDREVSTIHGTGPGCIADDDEADATSAPLRHRMQDLLDRMRDLHAITPAGIQARAHSLAQHAGHLGYSFDGDESTTVGALLLYLLRDAAALGRSGAVVKLPLSPDADLLGACAAFDALERDYAATFQGRAFDDPAETAAEAERERLHDQQDPYAEVIAITPAKTPEGLRAKARSIVVWSPDRMNARSGDRDNFMLASLLRDLIGGAA